MRRSLKRKHAALFRRLEAKYGVPPGPLIAIWGMETAFGRFTGNQNVLSAVATLAYDCRRPEKFRPQLMAALRNTAIGLLRWAGHTNIAAACRRMAAQPAQALALIGIECEN